MSLTELLSFDKKRRDRKRAKKTLSLKAHDIWAADKSEAVEMVAALSGWCDVVVMWEALRVILAWDDEREQVVWGKSIDKHVLERWFGLYCNIPGLSRSSSRRKGVFATVVNSVVTRSQARVIWSGQSGQEGCDAAECYSGGTCDGCHFGLRVRCEGEAFATIIQGQIGVCYNPKKLEKWAGSPPGKHRDAVAARRMRLIRKFLKTVTTSLKSHPLGTSTWSACGA
jgi:hypothetical protein